MSNDLQTTNNYFLPTSFEQAERFAEKIASSALCPAAFKGKPGDVFIAMQLGAEVGLSPMAAIQNISVINGRPSIWGDALLAIVRSHKHCLGVREWPEGSILDGTLKWFCGMTRKGQPEEIRSFSIDQAKKAGLWNKAGTWTNYPERMLQMRARGFCARDVFPDALRGLQCAEEVQDYIEVQVEPSMPTNMKLLPGQSLSQSFVADDVLVEKYLTAINKSDSWDVLKEIYNEAKKGVKGDKEASNKISRATKERQDFIRKQEESEEAIKQVESQPEIKHDHSEFLAALGD